MTAVTPSMFADHPELADERDEDTLPLAPALAMARPAQPVAPARPVRVALFDTAVMGEGFLSHDGRIDLG